MFQPTHLHVSILLEHFDPLFIGFGLQPVNISLCLSFCMEPGIIIIKNYQDLDIGPRDTATAYTTGV